MYILCIFSWYYSWKDIMNRTRENWQLLQEYSWPLVSAQQKSYPICLRIIWLKMVRYCFYRQETSFLPVKDFCYLSFGLSFIWILMLLFHYYKSRWPYNSNWCMKKIKSVGTIFIHSSFWSWRHTPLLRHLYIRKIFYCWVYSLSQF